VSSQREQEQALIRIAVSLWRAALVAQPERWSLRAWPLRMVAAASAELMRARREPWQPRPEQQALAVAVELAAAAEWEADTLWPILVVSTLARTCRIRQLPDTSPTRSQSRREYAKRP